MMNEQSFTHEFLQSEYADYCKRCPEYGLYPMSFADYVKKYIEIDLFSDLFSDDDTEELELDSCWDDVPDEYFETDYFEDDGGK